MLSNFSFAKETKAQKILNEIVLDLLFLYEENKCFKAWDCLNM